MSDPMLERQARERAELVERLDSTRLERAQAIVQARAHQAPVLTPPGGPPVTTPSPEFELRRTVHNLKLQDQAEVARLDGIHAQERGLRQDHNEQATSQVKTFPLTPPKNDRDR